MFDERGISRRQVLTSGAATVSAGLTGCLRFDGERGGSQTPTPTDSQTYGQRTFDFSYSDGTLVIRYGQGTPIPAGNLVVQSSDGTRVRWPELGSTAVSTGESVETGDTATVGPAVLNWHNAVDPSETVHVVFIGEEGSPTTLDRFSPSGATPATEPGPATPDTDRATETEADTEPDSANDPDPTAPGGTLLSDDFESESPGTYPSGWVSSGNDDDRVVSDVSRTGGKSFRLRGSSGSCWASLSHHQIALPDEPTLEIELSVRPTSQGVAGCHSFHTNIRLAVEPAGYPSDFFTIFKFRNDGSVGAANVGGVLTEYDLGQWYDLRLRYDQTGSKTAVTYHMNGEQIGRAETTTPSFADRLSYFTLSTSAFVSYFDTIRLSVV